MKVVFASDHAGFKLKQALMACVKEQSYEIEDCGAHEYNEMDDYPDFIAEAARLVAADPDNMRGIVIGGSGQGEAMVANRFKGVRAAVINDFNLELVRLSREHNDANILSLGARFIDESEACQVAMEWLSTAFSGEERHIRRINKIDHD
jgi:ribose 5-phosphate isomerase B